VALICLAVGVIIQNRGLISQQARRGQTFGMTVGRRVHNLAGVGLDGAIKPVALPQSGQRLLIIGMSPGCPACRENQKGWAVLASGLKQRCDEWQVVWISRDPLAETKEYWGVLGGAPPGAMADPPYRTYAQLGLAIVPRTITVLSDGRVDRVWTGKLSPKTWEEAFSYFGLKIPDMPL